MRLRRVFINDFRGIDSLEVRFDAVGEQGAQQLVVLAGPNGCGKTSVLEAILICLGRAELLPRRPDARHDVRRATTGFLIEAELEGEQGVTIRAKSGLSGAVSHSVHGLTAGNPTPPIADTKAKIPLPALPMAYFSSWRTPKLEGPVPITAGKPGKRPWRADDDRLWRIKSYFVNLKVREAFPGAPSLLKDEPSGADVLSRLNEAWRLFYPEVPYRFEAGVASDDVEEGFDFFAIRDTELRFGIPVDRLSSGEIEVLVFLASFLIEDYSGGILLIDEPELHLHPAWQRVVLKAVCRLLPKTQVICATHSALVLSELPSDQVRLLKREGIIMTASAPEDSYGLDANRVLDELMGAPERPQEVKAGLRRLFVLIQEGKLAEAKKRAASLRKDIHADPALTKADLLIRRKEALGR